MPSVRVQESIKQEIYFLTFTVHRWYYLFDRYNRWNILLESLKYCQANKELDIFHYVFMLNHIHLIARNKNMAGFIRDFKTFTSKQLKKNITETEPHILKLFDVNGEYHFWQKTNMPEVVINEDFYLVKAKYIEDNPVRKNYVREASHWFYSSANKAANLLELKSIFD